MNVKIDDDLARRVNLASAQIHLSMREYVEMCVCAGLWCHSSQDADLRRVFDYIDSDGR